MNGPIALLKSQPGGTGTLDGATASTKAFPFLERYFALRVDFGRSLDGVATLVLVACR
jgi:hypothetical protein